MSSSCVSPVIDIGVSHFRRLLFGCVVQGNVSKIEARVVSKQRRLFVGSPTTRSSGGCMQRLPRKQVLPIFRLNKT